MLELFQASLAVVNLPFTLFFALIFLYWLLVIVGLVDLDFLNIDVDLDMDAGGVEAGGEALGALQFFNLGYVPLMVVCTPLSLCLWAGSVLGNHYFNPNYSLSMAAFLLIPNFVISLVVTKAVTTPLRKLFQALHGESKMEKLNGKLCTMTSSLEKGKFGQAEITVGDSVVLIHVKTHNGAAISKGAQALIIDRDVEQDLYFIEEYHS